MNTTKKKENQNPYSSIGEIVGTNTLRIPNGMDILSVGLKLLTSHMSGGPVVDARGKYVGFISESDLLKAIEEEKDLTEVKAEDVMNTKLELISENTSIDSAVKHMRRVNIHNLPVVRNGFLVNTVTRHDLLRVMLDVSVGIEQ